MQVLTENGYVSSYALEGTITGGTEVFGPPDIEHFISHFAAYRLRDNVLEYDEEKNAENERKALCDELRKRREAECFSYVDRGQFWYDRLTGAQRTELMTWYTDWLNVTETLTSPIRPSWLE